MEVEIREATEADAGAIRITKRETTPAAIARRAVTEDLAAQMTDARTVGCTEFGEIITKLL